MGPPPSRDKIRIGSRVRIVQKQDQGTGKLTEGTVRRILTSSGSHPHGIKVELDGGKIGRVQSMSFDTKSDEKRPVQKMPENV